MPCAGLHTMVPTQGQSKQELCLPALFLGVGGDQGLLLGAAQLRQEWGHPDAPSP